MELGPTQRGVDRRTVNRYTEPDLNLFVNQLGYHGARKHHVVAETLFRGLLRNSAAQESKLGSYYQNRFSRNPGKSILMSR